MLKTSRAGYLAGPFPLFAVFSLAAVGVGCFVARASGAPVGEWARNLVAWVVGALVAGGLSRWAGRRAMLGFLIAAPLGLAATLFSGGQEGVHRWIQLGPLRMNVAEMLLPAALVASAAAPIGRRFKWLVATLALALLAAQPDASQATAYGGALIALIAYARTSRTSRAGGSGLVILAIVAAWLRRDPLGPVPEVEGIMGLAWRLAPVAAVAAWSALAGAALSPLAAGRAEGEDVRAAAVALAAYAALSGLAPLVGAFPVPLVGMGMSPILGLWLGMGLLAAVKGRRALTFAPLHAPFRAS